ncbi:primosomal protein DnaI [Rubeoparvulum massiliense]|uniref:primosomal protein DnaI n=1 Tax=Rubeoparvulum massiliense TaxID=1631346 RepID=UPI00065E708B|nr:primosomal protein DnaI [Rubeoparvulum massiliense]
MEELNKMLHPIRQRVEKHAGVSVDQILEDVMAAPPIMQLLKENPSLTTQHLLRSITQLDQLVREQKACENCRSLTACRNLLPGHFPEAYVHAGVIETRFIPCSYLRASQAAKQMNQLIRSMYVPDEVLAMNFKDLERDAVRSDALRALMQFCLQVKPGQRGTKGIYLYGPFGVGKSVMMAAAMKSLAERNIATLMVYLPELLRELKDSIQDNSLDEKLKVLKEVPVLILDDIGAESISPWVRDEIIGSILQARVVRNLPTLYTSNFSYDELEEYLSYSTKGQVETLKGKRIMERIRHYTDAYYVGGTNRRQS